jgi:hypothetical protein
MAVARPGIMTKMGYTPRLFCIFIASFICGCNGAHERVESRDVGSDVALQGDERAGIDEPDGVFEPTPVDWTLLSFGDDRQLTRLEIDFLAPGQEMAINPLPPLATIVCEDEVVLRKIEHALSSYSLIRAPKREIGGSGSVPSVEIRLASSDGKEFRVWIDRGFLLDNPVSSSSNRFFNWTFAKILDELRAEKLGERCKFEHFDSMTGEWHIRSQRDQWRSLRE